MQNCLSSHQLILGYTANTRSQHCSSTALSHNFSPLLWSLWQGTAVSSPHHFWGQILHSTAVFVYRTRSEHGMHTLDPAVFLLATPPPDYTIYATLESSYTWPSVWAKKVGSKSHDVGGPRIVCATSYTQTDIGFPFKQGQESTPACPFEPAISLQQRDRVSTCQTQEDGWPSR